MTDRRKFLIIANPVARLSADAMIETVRSAAPPNSEFDLEFTVRERFTAGCLRDRASGCDAVIAIGGDGTVAEAATAIESADIPIGIIPAGSTNVLARSFGVPTTPEDAARLLFKSRSRRHLDVGLCNGRRFLHMGGAGFDSRMFDYTDRRLKRRLGWLAYLQGATKSLLLPPSRFSVDVDGTSVECTSPLVIVANGPAVISPSIRVHPDIQYDDGSLDVIIITAIHASELARTVGRFATRALYKSNYSIHLKGKSIDIRADPPIMLQLDGDVIGDTPAHFSILPMAAQLIVPEGPIAHQGRYRRLPLVGR